ncbi:hypothetical protein [Paraglaciecola sp.]|uniref:hypothetical protein n=1 Tax=Paraglaciecola sp. TaxID=1920173 RepID=UPI0030F3A7AC
MTAIQILEKFGADASFDPSHVGEVERTEFTKLSNEQPAFNAPLTHSPADEDEYENEDTEEE